METSKGKYIEIAVGSVSNRAFVIKPTDLHKHIREKTELYRSLFTLDETAYVHFRDQGTIRSYKGKFSLDRIIFDIDKGHNSGEDTRERACRFIERLIELGCKVDLIRTWFSGRGFHIDIPNIYGFEPDENLPVIVKLTLSKQFGADIDNIYDRGRLIRVGHSYNLKSSLYKIPLDYDEIYSISYDEIKELAQEPLRSNGFNHSIVGDVEPIWKEHIQIPSKVVTEKSLPKGVKYNANVTCVQKMWNSDKAGQRHITLLRMINAWRRMGINKEMSLQGALYNVPSLEHNEIDKLVNDVYNWDHQGYGCNDVIMAEYCDQVCKFYKRKNFGLEVMSANEMSNKLKEFINTDFSQSSFNLKGIYDIPSDYFFMPGELAVLIGDTKLGKTAWLQNIVVRVKHMNVLYLSLEVNGWMIFRRFLQVGNEMSKDEIVDIYKTQDDDNIQKLTEPVKHINVMTTPPDIESMKEIISTVQPDIVVIDTIDAIDVKYENDPFRKMERIINSLKTMANEQDIIFFGISHISKGASNETLNVHSAKGSSAIEQKADKIIGITGDRDDSSRRVIRSLASRDEDGFELLCKFEYSTFQFKEIKC